MTDPPRRTSSTSFRSQHDLHSATATKLNTPSTSHANLHAHAHALDLDLPPIPKRLKADVDEVPFSGRRPIDDEDDNGDETRFQPQSGEITRVASPVLGSAEKKSRSGEQQEEEEEEWKLTLDDDEDPTKWKDSRKWATTALVCLIYCTATLTSSIATGAAHQYAHQFSVTPFHQSLILTVYMIGLAIGPPIWAPLSETYGRLTVNLVSLPGYTLFNIGCALSPSYTSLLVCRFFVGLCGASPQSNSGATISDVWPPAQRLWPMFIYTCAAFGGPVLGPLCGGFLAGENPESHRWRWIYWLLTILGGVSTLCVVLVQRETYRPVLLKRKALRLLREHRSGSGSGTATTEKVEAPRSIYERELLATLDSQRLTVRGVLTTHVSRPFKMLLTELPLAYAAAWTSFAYAVLFIFFEAFPVVFGATYGFTAGQVGLAFLPLGIGILATVPVVRYFNRLNLAIRRENAGRAPPEARLKQGFLPSPPCSFWFGWTARRSIHWISPMLATIPIGAGLIFSFNSLSVYVAECYTAYAASALGAMAFSRCILAVFVPLFGRTMFQGLGAGWAASILAFVSLAAVPIPFLFQRYGPAVRQRSRMAVKD
ncbi:uncharacterized protein PFL1_06310 [Pseudozyma flocculosa PF-1]|uniref:Major facilitator superfamily (MFS) profile domain-containing protein n=1 Tax=Pseudozyma flocculosa PF-1 TaxID=1277687 RepID=A0A061H0Y9_9BASI|nr:uncharacterized protein PFL1_06310 [Pseudozyma flocculosa PF-1]EPQ26102.1 hypothetical protein PFL1_06310 [Pseudozyma flocculosa PF-1]